jgi:aldose 1-epimerase
MVGKLFLLKIFYMFFATQQNDTVVLKSSTSEVTIWPNYGAILNNWTIALHGKNWEVIDGYDSPEDFKKNCESKGFRSCKLSPFVCRMNNSNYEFEGSNYKTTKFELAGHSIHGLLYDVPFDVVNVNANENSANVLLRHVYKGNDAGYPFHFTIEIMYSLGQDNKLTLSTTVTNTDDGSMPLSDGWHPYFSLGKKLDELQFVMDAETIVEFDDSLLPTRNLHPYHHFQQPELLNSSQLDNCFVLNHSSSGEACKLINAEDNIQLTISANENYPYLQVYTPPHRNSIAIENLSSIPDAFNNHIGLIVLAAGETESFSCSYKIGAIK